MRKVFHLVDSFNVGGTENQAVELALRLSSVGYDVTVGCLRAQGPLLKRFEGTPVVVKEFYPRNGIDSPSGAYQFARLSWFLRRGHFDIVHTHDLWSNLMGVPAAKMAGVRAIISSRRDLSHFDWYRGKKRIFLRRIQNLSGAIITNAAAIKEDLISEDGFPPEKLRVIHNGVELSRFNVDRRNRDRLFPEVGPGKLIVLVGNMHSDVKGHPWLIASAPLIMQEFPNTRFVLVGDGERRGDFEKQAGDLGLSGSFLFMGRRSDIPEILASCDIAVLPSRAEGLPNAVLEYLAAGLPTIVSGVGGNTELITHERTGLIVPPEDSAALSAAFLTLLRDPEHALSLAQRGHEFVVQSFSYERLVSEVDRLYSEVLQSSGEGR